MDLNNKKQIKTYKESYLMYERTKKETAERMSEAMNPDGSKRWTEEDIKNQLKKIQTAQNDIKEKYIMAGGDLSELENLKVEIKPTKKIVEKKSVVKKTSKETPTVAP